jgi:hypothetical protein
MLVKLTPGRKGNKWRKRRERMRLKKTDNGRKREIVWEKD